MFGYVRNLYSSDIYPWICVFGKNEKNLTKPKKPFGYDEKITEKFKKVQIVGYLISQDNISDKNEKNENNI